MRVLSLTALVFSLVPLAGCGASLSPSGVPTSAAGEPRETRPTQLFATSGRVGLTSFALAGRVTAQSARAVGGAIGGLVTGGLGGAETRWSAGSERTRDVARHEADAVRKAASAPE